MLRATPPSPRDATYPNPPENIYTDVTINAAGDADLSLNIDLTPNITARGSVGSDGSSSIGIFFEHVY